MCTWKVHCFLNDSFHEWISYFFSCRNRNAQIMCHFALTDFASRAISMCLFQWVVFRTHFIVACLPHLSVLSLFTFIFNHNKHDVCIPFSVIHIRHPYIQFLQSLFSFQHVHFTDFNRVSSNLLWFLLDSECHWTIWTEPFRFDLCSFIRTKNVQNLHVPNRNINPRWFTIQILFWCAKTCEELLGYKQINSLE